MSKQREKYVQRLDNRERKRIIATVQQIQTHHRNALDIKKLAGYTHRYRCRVGSIRIIFDIVDDTVHVIAIGPRGDVYDDM